MVKFEVFLHKKKNNKDVFICGLWCTTEDIPQDTCRVKKAVRHYGYLTAPN